MSTCENSFRPADGQKMEGVWERKFFAREPTAFPARRPAGGGHWISQEFLIK